MERTKDIPAWVSAHRTHTIEALSAISRRSARLNGDGDGQLYARNADRTSKPVGKFHLEVVCAVRVVDLAPDIPVLRGKEGGRLGAQLSIGTDAQGSVEIVQTVVQDVKDGSM